MLRRLKVQLPKLIKDNFSTNFFIEVSELILAVLTQAANVILVAEEKQVDS